MNQTKIGTFIAACRKEHNMTQVQFAEKLGVTNKAVSKWETGKCMPDVSLFDDICLLLNITLNELFAGERIAPENIEEKAEQNLISMAVKCQKREYQAVLCKYITIFFALTSVAINISVGGMWFEGLPVFSNMILTVSLTIFWAIFSRLTRENVSAQKITLLFNAILLLSSVTAFILMFLDIDWQIIFWVGLPCEIFFYGLRLMCDWIHIFVVVAVLAAIGLAYSKNNINISNAK